MVFKLLNALIIFVLCVVNTYGQIVISDSIPSTEITTSYSRKNTSNLENSVLLPVNASAKYFDLSDWALSVPIDLDKNGKADFIGEKKLIEGYTNEYFYASKDSGMVFKCPVNGYKTSKNTKYTRCELREMLRAGDVSIKSRGVTKNNWVFKSSPAIGQAGGYDGVLRVTLAVNHVTTTGHKSQVGRVMIARINGSHDEPLRLYYRKLPHHKKGSLYFAHDERDNGEERYYNLIGDRSNSAKDPRDGVALNEEFSYEVMVVNYILSVKIIRNNKPDVHKVITMRKSGHDMGSEFMYFKAGVYNLNNTGRSSDYVQATFYELTNDHKVYKKLY